MLYLFSSQVKLATPCRASIKTASLFHHLGACCSTGVGAKNFVGQISFRIKVVFVGPIATITDSISHAAGKYCFTFHTWCKVTAPEMI
mmetsp:Transcript_44734/g.76075  ORF Transcript_44734/g.76075 Transcript_44734/m.76075 type:complete len:88 (-) Transcript_44734:754-1017(-)